MINDEKFEDANRTKLGSPIIRMMMLDLRFEISEWRMDLKKESIETCGALE